MSATRTPIGSFGGSLKSLSATKLGAIAIQVSFNLKILFEMFELIILLKKILNT